MRQMVNERAVYSRLAGASLLVGVASVLVLHMGPTIIGGGARATGTSDPAVVAAFYSHPAMLPFWWQGGISLLAIALFAVAFRRHVQSFSPGPAVTAVADMGTVLAVAAIPLYALSAGMESAMVQLVAAGPAGRDALLGVFAAWDWTYNSFAYFFEAGYMAAWAFASWRTGALPRWIAVIGGLTAIGHLFNSQVLMNHLSDNLTLIPTALFLAWFVSAGIFLVRARSAVPGTESLRTPAGASA